MNKQHDTLPQNAEFRPPRDLDALIGELKWWEAFFRMHFFAESMPAPVLTFENARITSIGSFRVVSTDRGGSEQINLNRRNLGRPKSEVLASLLHQLTHSWESTLEPRKRSKGWYHSASFRNKMYDFGILCDERGRHDALNLKGEFLFQLNRHGVPVSLWEKVRPGPNGEEAIVSIQTGPKPKGKS